MAKTGYQVHFSPCDQFHAYFYHLSELSERLRTELEAADLQCVEYDGGGHRFRRCQGKTVIAVQAGELTGLSGDACCVDFGAVDTRVPPLDFANPAKYSYELLHYVSPVDYFTPEVRAEFEARLTSYDGTTPRTIEPKTGLINQDVAGTAQTNWFEPGKSWAKNPVDPPDTFIALVHDYTGAEEPIFSVGTSVAGLHYGVYSFVPSSQGRINRDFGEIKADGEIYCFDNFRSGTTAGGVFLGDPQGIILISLLDEGTLVVEKQGSAGSRCVASEPWEFTANATKFER